MNEQTLGLIKAGIDSVRKIQVKKGYDYYSGVAPTITPGTKEGYYRSVVMTGFKTLEIVPSGQNVPSDVKFNLFDTNYWPSRFAKAYDWDLDADEDDFYGEIAAISSDAMLAAMRTINKEVADIYNNAFTSGFNIYDAVVFASTAHTGAPGVANRANRPSTLKTFGSITLEEELAAHWDTLDPRGEIMDFHGNVKLVTSNTLFPQATRIVDASGLAESMDNDPNFAGRYVSTHRMPHMTSTEMWVLQNSEEDMHGVRWIDWGGVKVTQLPADRTLQKGIVVHRRGIAAVLQWEGTRFGND